MNKGLLLLLTAAGHEEPAAATADKETEEKVAAAGHEEPTAAAAHSWPNHVSSKGLSKGIDLLHSK